MKNSDRVPFWEKLVLGIGGFPSLFGYIGINTVARTVYILILGVNPFLVGLALFVGILLHIVCFFLDFWWASFYTLRRFISLLIIKDEYKC